MSIQSPAASRRRAADNPFGDDPVPHDPRPLVDKRNGRGSPARPLRNSAEGRRQFFGDWKEIDVESVKFPGMLSTPSCLSPLPVMATIDCLQYLSNPSVGMRTT